MFIDIAVIVFVSLGILFFLGTTAGLLRFPDFYTRMHAAGKGDTLSTVLILFGFALFQMHHFSVDTLLVALKILFIAVLIFITSPTATHAIMDAGYESNVDYWKKRKTSESSEDQPPGEGE